MEVNGKITELVGRSVDEIKRALDVVDGSSSKLMIECEYEFSEKGTLELPYDEETLKNVYIELAKLNKSIEFSCSITFSCSGESDSYDAKFDGNKLLYRVEQFYENELDNITCSECGCEAENDEFEEIYMDLSDPDLDISLFEDKDGNECRVFECPECGAKISISAYSSEMEAFEITI